MRTSRETLRSVLPKKSNEFFIKVKCFVQWERKIMSDEQDGNIDRIASLVIVIDTEKLLCFRSYCQRLERLQQLVRTSKKDLASKRRKR